MKKLKTFFIILVLLSSFTLTLPTLSYAVDIDPKGYKPSEQGIDEGIVAKYTGSIYNVLYAVAIIVSVITLMIIGLKFILGSAQEKAEYKQHLIPVVIGICFIALLFTIIGILSSFGDNIGSDVKVEPEVTINDPEFIGPKKPEVTVNDSEFVGPKKP